jgi:hypothetical protein
LVTAGPPAHGRPYTAEDIGSAIQRVENRLPDRLRADWLAPRLADAIWTFDGQRYRELAISGSCDDNAPRCDLHLSGLPAFALNREEVDGYTFNIDLTSQQVELAGRPSLKGFPAAAIPMLDSQVRALDELDQLRDMTLRYVTWAIPPPSDAYVLSYATGTQEGDRRLFVLFDRGAGEVISVTPDQ